MAGDRQVRVAPLVVVLMAAQPLAQGFVSSAAAPFPQQELLPPRVLEQIEGAWAEGERQELAVRLERLTRPLLGARYQLSPLGEAQPPDADPRLRFDAFDCTTFIETALALTWAERLEGVERLLDRIRYRGGAPSFAARRHLVVAQWIPGLTGLGWLEEITAGVGGGAARSVVLELDRRRWHERTVARHLELAAEALPEGRFLVPYLPLGALDALLERVPPGTVLNVVRSPLPGSPIVVTHQALLLHDERGRPVIRHAAEGPGRVVDQTPAQFLARLRKPKKWPVLGLNLQRVRQPYR